MPCVWLVALLVTALPRPRATLADNFPCLEEIRSTDSLILADPGGGQILAKNESIPRIPASTLKLFTSLVAIHELGIDYRFKTEFYTDKHHNLIIKGYGDPLLISEVLREMAKELLGKISHVNAIFLDNTYFSRHITIPGRGHSTNPYDAPPSALSANFNTIKVARDKKGEFISGEPQTPITPLARKIARHIGATKGRYCIGDDPELAARYTGELICAFLADSGIPTPGITCIGAVPQEARLILEYYSPFTLRQVIQKMLEFSSNFMANQLMLAMGAKRFGPPATLEKGVRVLREFAMNDLGLKEATIIEGSGISRKNRISAQGMLKVLRKFRPYYRLLKSDGKLYYKTGTLRGIRTCAGYIRQTGERFYPFAILINRPIPGLDSIIRCLQDVVVFEKAH